MREPLADVIVLGAGGDGLVVAECLRQLAAAGQPLRLAGFLDDTRPVGESLEGAPVFGRLDEWRSAPAGCQFIPAIHKVRDMPRRAMRIEELGIPGDRWAIVQHPSAVVAGSARVGRGAFIGSFVTIQTGVCIGRWASIRAGANIGHDAVVEDFGYVGPNATLCGRATVSYAAHVGPNSAVLDAKNVGRFAVVGIASAVTKNVPDGWVVMGNPAERVGVVAGSNAEPRAVRSVRTQ